MKRISIFAIIALMLSAMASCTYNPLDSYRRIPPDRTQEDENNTGGMGGKFASGFGTESSPYVIRTANHLRNMALGLLPGEMVYFSLESDIDISQFSWMPLNNADPYSNFIDFEGNGHVIKGLSCRGNSYGSFFGILCGNCRNVGFIDADISGSNASAVIAGYIGVRSPGSANYTGTVENCYVSGTVAGSPAGGIAGYMGTAYNSSSCYVRNCYSAADINSKGNAGGIAGNLLTGSEISCCYAAGSVVSSSYAGGIAGLVEGTANVHDCVAWNDAVVGERSSLFGSSNVSGCLAWEGIMGIELQEGVKTAEELSQVVVAWGEPWHEDRTAANGFPAFKWMVERGDVLDICGLKQRIPDEPDPYDPSQYEKITEGDGSQGNPYLVYSASQLNYVDSVLVAGSKIYVKLMKNIDMNGSGSWHPWNEAEPFDKEIDFDGNGKTISNFKCSNVNYASMFGVLYGSCHDITFDRPSITSNVNACGVLGGYIGTGGKPGVVRNVAVVGGTLVAEFRSDFPVGGLAGHAREATIEDCKIDMTVTNKSTSSNNRSATGGIVGKTNSANDVIKNCSFSGAVKSEKNEKYTGGIVGWSGANGANIEKCTVDATITGNNERIGGVVGHYQGGFISDCTVKGTITTNANIVGGIAGIAGSASIIVNCRVEADVTGNLIVGGILGKNENTVFIRKCATTGDIKAIDSSIGGIAGDLWANGGMSAVENCFSSGRINGNQRVGGIAGDIKQNVSVDRCCSTSEVSSWQVAGGIVGRACNGGWSWDSEHGNDVSGCIAWNSKIATTRKNEDGGSSGAVIGFTSIKNTLADCVRNPKMTFDGSWADKGLPCDQENADRVSPLSYTSYPGFNYIYPYHGKTAAASETASDVARRLGWDETIWDLSGSVPALK